MRIMLIGASCMTQISLETCPHNINAIRSITDNYLHLCHLLYIQYTQCVIIIERHTYWQKFANRPIYYFYI